QQQPGSAELQLRIGQCHAFHGRTAAADAAADKAIAAAAKHEGMPILAEAWLLKATVAQRTGDGPGATQAIAKALDAAAGELALPMHAELLARAIESALQRGDLTEAVARHEQLKKLLPQAPLTEGMGAQLQLAQGRAS